MHHTISVCHLGLLFLANTFFSPPLLYSLYITKGGKNVSDQGHEDLSISLPDGIITKNGRRG